MFEKVLEQKDLGAGGTRQDRYGRDFKGGFGGYPAGRGQEINQEEEEWERYDEEEEWEPEEEYSR